MLLIFLSENWPAAHPQKVFGVELMSGRDSLRLTLEPLHLSTFLKVGYFSDRGLWAYEGIGYIGHNCIVS